MSRSGGNHIDRLLPADITRKLLKLVGMERGQRQSGRQITLDKILMNIYIESRL